MYGTLIRCRPKAGQEKALTEFADRWWQERAAKVGCVAEFAYRCERHPGEVIVAVVFESKEAYQRNAADPEQDRGYQEFRSLLEADPEFEDGEIFWSRQARS